MRLNVFLTTPTKAVLSALQQQRKHISCLTLPYGTCPPEVADFPQAVLVPDPRLPADLCEKHPNAQAVFSFTPLTAPIPNILCTPPAPCDAPYVCFSLPPPDSKIFCPHGMTPDHTATLRHALRGRNPETVTVELFLGAYAVPFPYDGTYRTCSLGEALTVAQREGALVKMNKNHYYSYIIHSNNSRAEALFFLQQEGLLRMITDLKALGISRFALSAEEVADEGVRPLLSLFKNYS